jgi:hypothetical protein
VAFPVLTEYPKIAWDKLTSLIARKEQEKENPPEVRRGYHVPNADTVYKQFTAQRDPELETFLIALLETATEAQGTPTVELKFERKSLVEAKSGLSPAGIPRDAGLEVRPELLRERELRMQQAEADLALRLEELKTTRVKRLLAIGTFLLAVFSAMTTMSPRPQESRPVPSIVFSLRDSLLRFLRPLLVKIEPILLQSLQSLQAGENPRIIKQNLIDHLVQLKREEEAASKTLGDTFAAKQIVLRINQLISAFQLGNYSRP